MPTELQPAATGQYTFYFSRADAAGYAVEAIEKAGLTCTRDGDAVTVVAESYQSMFGQSHITRGDCTVAVANNVTLVRVEANGTQIWPPADNS